MSRLLEVDGLELVEMPADGHCLFYALSHQLKERYEKARLRVSPVFVMLF